MTAGTLQRNLKERRIGSYNEETKACYRE